MFASFFDLIRRPSIGAGSLLVLATIVYLTAREFGYRRARRRYYRQRERERRAFWGWE